MPEVDGRLYANCIWPEGRVRDAKGAALRDLDRVIQFVNAVPESNGLSNAPSVDGDRSPGNLRAAARDREAR